MLTAAAMTTRVVVMVVVVGMVAAGVMRVMSETVSLMV